jgi:hypothetical protein
MGTRHSECPRADSDFYTEPAWTVAALLHHLLLSDGLHDPCCGSGTVIDTAASCGLKATGADIADRAARRFAVRDFLTDESTYRNIVTNPPYHLAPEIICHALAHVSDGGRVAALVPLGFIASQRRYQLFSRPACELAVVLSRRPSLPPGGLLQRHGESIRGGGSTDFLWIGWQRGRATGATRSCWIAP